MPKHCSKEDCEQFLQQENQSLTPALKKIIDTYLRVSEENLDEFLVLIPNKVRNENDLHKILRFMRAHKQIDEEDYNKIFNNSGIPTVERKVSELLAVVSVKDRHAFWFLAHSFESKQEPLYRHLHGSITCCVCKEIRQKEKEEDLDLPDLESDPTVISFTRSLMETFKEKCSTTKAAMKRVRERRKEKNNAANSNTVSTTEEYEDANNPLEEDKETGDEDNTDAEAVDTDLESDVTEGIVSLLRKAFKEAIDQKCTTARAAVRRARKNATSSRKKFFSRKHSHEESESADEDFVDAEDFRDETDDYKKVKDEVNASKELSTVATQQQLCVVTRRKRAYKAAFTTLSAVSLYTFYPLPVFDFLFLFLYCNFLILLITF